MSPIRASGALALAGALTIAAAAPAVAQPIAPATGGAAVAAPTPVTAVFASTGGAAAATARGTTPRSAAPRSAKRRSRFSIASARRNIILGNRTLVQGTLRPARAGRRVRLQVRVGGTWRTMARDVTDRRGAWRLRFTPRRPGALRSRVAFAGDWRARRATRSVGTVNVFRRALASWYGPGLYGGHLACGGRLSPGTLGVAHKKLPCGTRVTLRHRGRSVRVSVIDRGPYVGAREFDLTSATRLRLGFSGTGIVLTTR